MTLEAMPLRRRWIVPEMFTRKRLEALKACAQGCGAAVRPHGLCMAYAGDSSYFEKKEIPDMCVCSGR